MTSSLVVSEMCIRDRYIGEHAGDNKLFQTQNNPTVILSCNVRRDASVSYTHLTLPTICSV
eukprot:9989679-Prorocentrum_lima.AAC.1